MESGLGYGKASSHRQIVQLVHARLAEVPQLRESAIQVDERHGIVTLSGRVDSYRTYYAAQAAAARVRGVKHVINDLEVRQSADAD
jgi:osmotically-inducible protein OsmY